MMLVVLSYRNKFDRNVIVYFVYLGMCMGCCLDKTRIQQIMSMLHSEWMDDVHVYVNVYVYVNVNVNVRMNVVYN